MSVVTDLNAANERQERLLQLIAEGYSDSAAAEETGYSEGTVRVYRSRHKDKIETLARERLSGRVPVILGKLYDMATDDETPANTRLAAIRDWLDRAGWGAVHKSEVKRSYEDAWQSLVDACGGDEGKARSIVETLRGKDE